MPEQVGSVTRKKSSYFHGGIRFQSSFTIRWELEDKTFLKIDIINFIPFSNCVTFRKPRGTYLVAASELIPGFCRSKGVGVASHDQKPDKGIVSGIKSPPLARTPPRPHGIYIDRCITRYSYGLSSFCCCSRNCHAKHRGTSPSYLHENCTLR